MSLGMRSPTRLGTSCLIRGDVSGTTPGHGTQTSLAGIGRANGNAQAPPLTPLVITPQRDVPHLRQGIKWEPRAARAVTGRVE